MGKIKTDNRSLAAKVALRRWLLGAMGITTVRVLDTCAGAGHVWTAMREHVTVERWVRCDIKPRQVGTLRLSALQAVHALPLDAFNVIDIDPYGEPWAPYLHALRLLRQDTAFFLTRGHLLNVVTTHEAMMAVGIPTDWPVPRTPALAAFVDGQVLAQTWRYGNVLHSAQVVLPNVSYYALALQPTPEIQPL